MREQKDEELIAWGKGEDEREELKKQRTKMKRGKRGANNNSSFNTSLHKLTLAVKTNIETSVLSTTLLNCSKKKSQLVAMPVSLFLAFQASKSTCTLMVDGQWTTG